MLDLIPPQQEAKLAQIRAAGAALHNALHPAATAPAPSDPDKVAAIRGAAAALERLSQTEGAAAASASRLAPLLHRLAEAEPARREAVENALVAAVAARPRTARNMLHAEPVSLKSLPPDIARDWLAPDGGARIEILPKADPNDSAAMRRFVRAVLAVAPDAAGTPIQLYQSERTVIRAFIEAGVLAVVAIGIMLWAALRRVGDVLLTLLPLLVAGLVTLELMVVFGLSLNFANVIALPLLLGVGVAFKIYYIMAWRSGRTNLLQSTLTRAVFFSALTTATAFGSLWLSPQPGTVEHGPADGAGAGLHDDGGGAVPAGADGAAAPTPCPAGAARPAASRRAACATCPRQGAGERRVAMRRVGRIAAIRDIGECWPASFLRKG